MDQSVNDTNLLPKYILAELKTLDTINQPIQVSSRFRYTCQSISEKFIALGTSIGAVNVFNKSSNQYIYNIPGHTGPIAQIAFNPADEKLLAVANSSGDVSIHRLQIERRGRPDLVKTSNHHKNFLVKQLVWNQNGDKLLIGDDKGQVSLINLFRASTKASSLLNFASDIILRLETPIVQIDSFADKALVSTLTKTFICDTHKHKFSSIGSKERNGQYGACFYSTAKSELPVLYCGRPGSRLWEADYQGAVMHTHQFKHLLCTPPLKILHPSASEYSLLDTPQGPQSIHFPQLRVVDQRHLLTWTDKALYVFDPIEGEVVLWNDEIQNALDVSVFKNEIYVLYENSAVHCYNLLPVSKAVAILIEDEHWLLACCLCDIFKDLLIPVAARCHLPVQMIEELIGMIDPHRWDVEKLESLLLNLELSKMERSSSLRGSKRSTDSFEKLESGIFVVKPTKQHRGSLRRKSQTAGVKNSNSMPDAENTTEEYLVNRSTEVKLDEVIAENNTTEEPLVNKSTEVKLDDVIAHTEEHLMNRRTEVKVNEVIKENVTTKKHLVIRRTEVILDEVNTDNSTVEEHLIDKGAEINVDKVVKENVTTEEEIVKNGREVDGVNLDKDAKEEVLINENETRTKLDNVVESISYENKDGVTNYEVDRNQSSKYPDYDSSNNNICDNDSKHCDLVSQSLDTKDLKSECNQPFIKSNDFMKKTEQVLIQDSDTSGTLDDRKFGREIDSVYKVDTCDQVDYPLKETFDQVRNDDVPCASSRPDNMLPVSGAEEEIYSEFRQPEAEEMKKINQEDSSTSVGACGLNQESMADDKRVNVMRILDEALEKNERLSWSQVEFCVQSALASQQQRHAAHALLEKLDGYLWSRRSPLVHPEFQTSGGTLHPTIEDLETHWGTTVDLKQKCFVCEEDLISDNDAPIIILPCGHAFHKPCCDHYNCLLCLSVV